MNHTPLNRPRHLGFLRRLKKSSEAPVLGVCINQAHSTLRDPILRPKKDLSPDRVGEPKTSSYPREYNNDLY